MQGMTAFYNGERIDEWEDTGTLIGTESGEVIKFDPILRETLPPLSLPMGVEENVRLRLVVDPFDGTDEELAALEQNILLAGFNLKILGACQAFCNVGWARSDRVIGIVLDTEFMEIEGAGAYGKLDEANEGLIRFFFANTSRDEDAVIEVEFEFKAIAKGDSSIRFNAQGPARELHPQAAEIGGIYETMLFPTPEPQANQIVTVE